MKKIPNYLIVSNNFRDLEIKTDIFNNSIFLLKWYLPAYKVSIFFFVKTKLINKHPTPPINPTETIHSLFILFL